MYNYLNNYLFYKLLFADFSMFKKLINIINDLNEKSIKAIQEEARQQPTPAQNKPEDAGSETLSATSQTITQFQATEEQNKPLASNLNIKLDLPDSDNPKALYEYGYFHEFLADDLDLERAGYYYLKASNLGYADAMYRLAKYYENPRRAIGRDRTKAEFWYKKAIKQGHKKAKVAYQVMLLRKSHNIH